MNTEPMKRSLGGCALTNEPCFEVVRRHEETREPIKLGAALPEAIRANFLLADGNNCDITLHKDAFDRMTPADYPQLWLNVLGGFLANGRDHPWTRKQFDNGILGLIRAKPWSEFHDRL